MEAGGASSGMPDQDDDEHDTSFETTTVDAREILDAFPIPHLIVDPASQLHSINAAARHVLGLPPVPHDAATPRLRADSIFSTTSEAPGSTASERLMGELFRLSKVEASWGSADAIEVKSTAVPGLSWAAEIKVRAFTPKGVDGASSESLSASGALGEASSTWFSVVLLRPLPGRSDARAATPSKPLSSLSRPAWSLVEGRRKGSSSDRTPTVFATEWVGDPFARAMGQSVGGTEDNGSKTMVADSEEPSSESGWAHTVHDANFIAPSASTDAATTGFGVPVSSTADETQASASAATGRPTMRMHLSALPVPATPPLSSAGTGSSKLSSHASLFTNGGATSSPATSAQSANLPSMLGSESSSDFAFNNGRTAEPIPEATEPDTSLPGSKLPTPAQEFATKAGMGVTVSSAGIHLSTSVAGPPIATPSISIPASASISPLLGKTPGDPIVPSSPRPTALPPPAPKPHVTPPEPSFLLKFAALSSLPKTGVIIADSDLASGFVNSIARELLMGVPADTASAAPRQQSSTSPAGENSSSSGAGGGSAPMASDSESLNDWWSAGAWSSEDGWSAFSSSTSSSSFFPPQPQSMFADPESPFDLQGSRDLTHASIIASGEARPTAPNEGTAGSSIRIGKAHESNRYRATVAAILARSLASDEKRRARASPRSQKLHTHEGKDPKDRWATFGDHDSAAFVAAGSKQGKKPYKVFDHSFSQRIIDPFEPLLEICARRGEYPTPYTDDDDGDDDGGATSGMIVGIEVEVWESAEELKNGSFVTSTSAARKKRVRRRLVEISAAPIFAPRASKSRNGGKQHLGGVLLLRDVTDDSKRRAGGWGLKDASKKKKKSDGDAYYKQIVDSMPQLVWTTSVKGSHTYFNQQWYTYTNLEPEQFLGVGWQNPFHEDDMPAALTQWTHSLETGDPYSVEYRCRRGDGAWRWMLGRALPLRDADGDIQGWFGTCTDVDEFVNLSRNRLQIRTELSKTQEQFKATLEGADVIILAIDTTWHCTFFQGSHRAAIVKDIPDGKIEGKSIKDLWPDWPLYEKCEIVMEGKALREQLEWTPARAKDQNSFYRCLITPLTEKLPDGKQKITGCIIVATDVTDMRIAQEQLRESYEERAKLLASETAAIEASRLKTEFVANTSHGEFFLLLDDPTLPEQHRSSVAKIMRSGEILLEMIGMVLDMGKVEAGRLDLEHRPFSIDEILNDARMFSTSAEKKGLTFKEQIGPYYHGTVLGDMPRLRQVLANVLSNAIKFTKKGGITMHLEQEHETESHVQIRFEVHDTGVGIKKDAIPLLFKPFHQADASTARQFGGTGLGLCIAKNLLALMGGTIDLSSEYGVGTKMTVVVPLEKAPDGTTEDATPLAEPGVDLVRENVWILVTDDNELNREIITKTLIKMRFNVESASNGVDAIEAVQRRQFDLILMDGQMDTMDGYEATQRIRQMSDPKLNRVKIIALTASAIQGDEERCLRAGMNGYLAKPVRARVLEATILKHLARPPAPPPLSRHTSGATSPCVETAQLMSFDFPDTIPEVKSSSAIDTQGVPRRRPSHPSYSIDAVPNSGNPSGLL
ncbi:BQ2448_6411 [Microbotryum intermedium]|uniref:histidine kinase n=1 Tax=Microbotryum intermedium TaxID=269621 RepID=A0A238FP55_9BASI|nr:BQ2448_6411 [Microbotryum intermedium]